MPKQRSSKGGRGARPGFARKKRPAKTTVAGRRAAERDGAPAAIPSREAEAGGIAEHAETTSTEPKDSFPIVGIGASAGGLEALEQFLRRVPEHSGMAYVVIQHLDPSDRGGFIDLLRRASPMPVEQATDRKKVQPDHVYVIPPAKDISLLHGVLHVMPQASPRGLNLPIDLFFRSLAEDRQERAIAVVLSGMGTDGTLGLRAIKEKGGATFVQALTSAKFDGMPRSALDAGLADVVAPAVELPGRILAYHHHAVYAVRPEVPGDDKHQTALAKVFILLRAQTGNDFSLYKRSTVYRRIERRMGLHQIDKIANYVRFLRENPKEVELLFKELLIGVTSFFRDPATWDHLKTQVLPDVLASHPPGGTVRAWVAGCSTGEEAYSLAMVLKEAMEARKELPAVNLQIFATDLDREAIEKARLGVYPANIVADVSPERLRRFFVKDERGYRVNKEIREAVVFAPQNIVMDPPFTKLDLLCCRNLLIYLSPEVQKKLIPLFHYALSPRGVLFLGSAETVGSFGGLFAPLDGKTRLYRRLEDALSQVPVEMLSSYRPPAVEEPGAAAEPGEKPARGNIQILADRVIVQHFAPTAVLTNDKGDILYISGRTGKFLEPAVGRANMNVFAMAREGLRYELSAAFAAGLKEDRPITVRGIRVGTNGGTQLLDVTVQRLLQPRELRGTVMVVFAEVAAPSPEQHPSRRPPPSHRVAELATELQRAQEELQSTREEMQTSQEELKSMNEELQSTNEELQSTNEELTTSKEEMQSMNEELQTVNHELQSKVDELSRSNNDMKNLLNSTDIATLFLDGDLLIRRFTAPTSKLIKLIPADTGRPITDIATELQYPDMAVDAREVLRTLIFKERQVVRRDGHWFNVRILPYRTLDNVIDGVVITFSEVTETKVTEARLREQADALAKMVNSLPAAVWSCRADGVCDYASQRLAEVTGAQPSELMGHGWLDQVHPQDRDRVREAWRAAVRAGSPLDIELRLLDGKGGARWYKTRSLPVRDDQGNVVRWYGTHTDIDELKGGPDPEGGLRT